MPQERVCKEVETKMMVGLKTEASQYLELLKKPVSFYSCLSQFEIGVQVTINFKTD